MVKRTKEEIKALFDSEAPDCGDNSCRFARKKGGMRTNGGCRCFDQDPIKVKRYTLLLLNFVENLLEEEK